MGIYAGMRFAGSLFVIAVGAILALAVPDAPDDSVRVHVIGMILLLTGLAGLAMAYQLFVSRRRTDIIYREDGATWLEPNTPSPSEPWEPVERHVLRPLPERYSPTVHVVGAPVDPVDRHEPIANINGEPQAERAEHVVHGVMDVEPGSAEFQRMAETYDD